MPDETKHPETPRDALTSVRELLAGLEPEDQITLVDSLGNDHELRTVLPARRHIRVLRLLDQLVQKVGDDGEITGNGMRRLVAGLRKAIHNEEAVALVGKIFAEAYPATVQAAAQAAPDANSVDPLDLFPLESILEGIVPLGYRLLAKALAMADRTTGQKMKQIQSMS